MAHGILFEEMVEMGYPAPASQMVDFSDHDYKQALDSGRFEMIDKQGMKAVFIDGKFKRMHVNGQWITKVDSIEAATAFFKS